MGNVTVQFGARTVIETVLDFERKMMGKSLGDGDDSIFCHVSPYCIPELNILMLVSSCTIQVCQANKRGEL